MKNAITERIATRLERLNACVPPSTSSTSIARM
jgi:hypothetical protein